MRAFIGSPRAIFKRAFVDGPSMRLCSSNQLNLPEKVRASQEGRGESSGRYGINKARGGEQGLKAHGRMPRARASAAGCLNNVNGAPLKTNVGGKSECLAYLRSKHIKKWKMAEIDGKMHKCTSSDAHQTMVRQSRLAIGSPTPLRRHIHHGVSYTLYW